MDKFPFLAKHAKCRNKQRVTTHILCLHQGLPEFIIQKLCLSLQCFFCTGTYHCILISYTLPRQQNLKLPWQDRNTAIKPPPVYYPHLGFSLTSATLVPVLTSTRFQTTNRIFSGLICRSRDLINFLWFVRFPVCVMYFAISNIFHSCDIFFFDGISCFAHRANFPL